MYSAIRNFARLHETKLRFLVAGGVNTALGLTLFPFLYLVLRPLRIHYVYLLVASGVICVLFSFLTNKLFVFRTHGNWLRELFRFVMFHLSQIALSLAGVPFLVEFTGVSPIVAQPPFAILVILTSYFWHKHVSFVGKPILLTLKGMHWEK
jgi:putative flippase GtrA